MTATGWEVQQKQCEQDLGINTDEIFKFLDKSIVILI